MTHPARSARGGARRAAISLVRFSGALALAVLGACGDRSAAPVGPEAPSNAPPASAVEALTCKASRRTLVLSCHAAGPVNAGTSAQRIVGGQGVYIRLRSGNVTFDSATQVLSADVTVQSLASEWLGTPDSTTVTGIRVFFSQGPVVVAGQGEVAVADPDGYDTFTASTQPYYSYPVIVKPLEVSPARTWRFQLSPGVEQFSFGVYLSTEVTGHGAQLEPVSPVRVTVAGLPWADTGAVALPDADVVMQNGLLRLRRTFSVHTGSHRVEGFSGGQWTYLNSALYGDWTFITASVITPPTAVEVLVNTDTLAAVRWTYANHVVPARYTDTTYAYPFTKTVWLRARDRGYYVRFDILSPAPDGVTAGEHEVGWGGVNRNGRIRTSTTDVLTDTLANNLILNAARGVDALEYDVTGDPWRRVVVPMPTDQMVIGVFSGNISGAWYYGLKRRAQYGAYVYAAPVDDTPPTRTVCRDAIARAPFPLPEMDAANCGPTP
ncbi:hypothetical protein [Longimicrobium sp.]|uniref:hypothetical protein n=1 Tax=Longimicrobium sp. TaxID=2029185 RepID=UPI002B788E35|nr:hypothetical protein [Longimicrobium sp.]HSU17252.1 hypothetical protein [Longimicrobium sp.]